MSLLVIHLVVTISFLGFAFYFYLKRQDPLLLEIATTACLLVLSCIDFVLLAEKKLPQILFLAITLLYGLKLYPLNALKLSDHALLKKTFSKKELYLLIQYFIFQAALACILSLNFIVVYKSATHFLLTQMVAIVIFLIALSLEIIAYFQMLFFKESRPSKSAVLKTGLFKYSRHPNYFFEVVIWISFALYGSTCLLGVLGWISPFVLLYLILEVTGIPPLEKRLVQMKGDNYKYYQATTSKFMPWRPK
jgi:steroid 5-alpha reductase family enzyme